MTASCIEHSTRCPSPVRSRWMYAARMPTARCIPVPVSPSVTPRRVGGPSGVPLTLLRLQARHRYGVFELGANHKGEIAYTSSLVEPRAAVIVNVGSAHLEGFGSRQGIAEEGAGIGA